MRVYDSISGEKPVAVKLPLFATASPEGDEGGNPRVTQDKLHGKTSDSVDNPMFLR
jgi:hypothetical protein